MKKLLLSLLVLTFILSSTLLVLAGCQPKNDYNSIYDIWQQDQVVSIQGVDTSCALLGTTGAIPSDDHGYVGDSIVVGLNQNASYTVTVQEAGRYNILVNFFILHNGLRDTEFNVTVNGKLAINRSPLKALWALDSQEFSKDSFGNEIVPSQSKAEIWQQAYLYNFDHLTALPVAVDLNAGENIILLEMVSGSDVLLGDVRVQSVQNLVSYADYKQAHANKTVASSSNILEAEHPTYKDDSSIVPTSSSDVNATNYDTYSSLLNTISGFNNSSQTIYYEFIVEEEGLYELAFNYMASTANRTVFTTIRLDGQVPFGEMLHYPFANSSSYTMHVLGNGEENFKFYLTKGVHTLAIAIDSSLVSEEIKQLDEIIADINTIYLDLKKIAGSSNDSNREWNPDTDFPGVVERLQSAKETIAKVYAKLIEVNSTDANYQAVISLIAAENALEGLLEKPMSIANNYAKLSEGSGSVVQTLANAQTDIKSTGIDFDRIVFAGNVEDLDIKKRGAFFSLWEGVKKFFYSFTADYSNVTEEDNVIQVWVARSRQYVDLMQQMIDDTDFQEKTGYKVKFSILTDEGKLIMSNAAGIAPDVVMGISNWLPYEMGIRDLTYDLTQFDDYGEVISRFSEGAMISLIADGKGLALPETQDFYVMYYRKDIVERYNIQLPQTWTDVKEILPTLQRYGMNFYIPLSSSTATKSIMTTAPFIYQMGGDLFSEDATTTTIDQEESINAIKLMTELYTLYGLPQQVNDFFDSFRNGSLPIGVSTFDTFVKLSFAAPEISGQWGISLAPGVTNEDGVIERWQTGSSTSVVLMDNDDHQKASAGWELLKWWTDANTQTEFMNRLTMIYGKAYIWNSANVDAFNNSVSFTEEQKAVITEQWTWMREIPKVPGWYMLERELSNAWNNIVINSENTRAVIEDAATRVNKELQRKLTELGYMENGVIVKPYLITTLEYIQRLKQ